MNHKLISIALLTTMLASLTACGGEAAASDTTTAAPVDTTTPETDSPFVPDDLPADLDLTGQTVDIMIGDYNNAYLSDMYIEEATGNRLDDAVYNTIKSVQDRLGVTLNYTSESYAWAGLSTFQSKITANIMAGDDSIDLFFDAANYTAQMSDGEYFIDLADTKYIDLDKPWYNQTVRANMPDGKPVHFLVGQFALANIKNTFALYYNADLYDTLGKTEDLYALVDAGKWTIEKLSELLKDTYADLNGNTTVEPTDQFGLTFGDSNKYMGFFKALGVDIFTKSKDGYEFAYDSEQALTAIDYLQRLINENENVLLAKLNTDNPDYHVSAGGGNYASKPFMEGRSLFTASLIADAATIVPEIGFSYGLLPYPKWDENQENYQNMLQRSCYAMIPTTATDADAASAVLEALSSQSYRSLVPEYCEVSLKTRYSQDDDVSRMFDLIINSIVFDPGEIYANLLGTPSGLVKSFLNDGSQNWASFIASRKDALVEKMNSIVE